MKMQLKQAVDWLFLTYYKQPPFSKDHFKYWNTHFAMQFSLDRVDCTVQIRLLKQITSLKVEFHAFLGKKKEFQFWKKNATVIKSGFNFFFLFVPYCGLVVVSCKSLSTYTVHNEARNFLENVTGRRILLILLCSRSPPDSTLTVPYLTLVFVAATWTVFNLT